MEDQHEALMRLLQDMGLENVSEVVNYLRHSGFPDPEHEAWIKAWWGDADPLSVPHEEESSRELSEVLSSREKYRAEKARRKARLKRLPNTLTDEHWQNALDHFGNLCAVCEKTPRDGQVLRKDHWIPITSKNCPGTVPANIVPLCNQCNSQKNATDPYKWLVKKFGIEVGNSIYYRITEYLRAQEAE